MSLLEINPSVLKEDVDVDSRLKYLELDRDKLISVVHDAMAARADCTVFDAANAPGTFAYLYGTRKLRFVFSGDSWASDRTDSIEAIKNTVLKIKVIFQNVDIACSMALPPKPISEKGPSSERACWRNQGDLFGFENLPLIHAGLQQPEDYKTYYLMVDKNGSAELSRPIIENKTFSAFIERIFIADSDLINNPPVEDSITTYTDDIDFDITKKKEG